MRPRPGPFERRLIWPLCLGLLLGLLAVGWVIHTALPRHKGPERLPLPASTTECDPALERCVLVEYLLYRDKAIGGVYTGGVLTHCRVAFCAIGQPYTPEGDLDTPEEIIAVSGCPDRKDGVEALDLLAEYKSRGSPEGRYALGLRDRA